MEPAEEAEHVVNRCIVPLGFGGVHDPHPLAVARRMRVRVTTHGVGDLLGWFDPERWTVHVAPHDDIRIFLGRVAHELGHAAGRALQCSNYISDEFAEPAGQIIQVPTWGARMMVRTFGLVPSALLAAYPLVEPSTVLARCAQVTDHIVILHIGERRLVHTCNFRATRTKLRHEQHIVRQVLTTGAMYPVEHGIKAYPYVEVSGLLCVAIVAELDGMRQAV